ncbi:hypothetical protein CF319_g8987 [Tilletia indica]|nr:hypothetical protein CF319_g8987 [Tilletia indica]
MSNNYQQQQQTRAQDEGSRSRSSSAASQQQQQQHSQLQPPPQAIPSSSSALSVATTAAESTYSSSSSAATTTASSTASSPAPPQQPTQLPPLPPLSQPNITPALLGAYHPDYMQLHMTATPYNIIPINPITNGSSANNSTAINQNINNSNHTSNNNSTNNQNNAYPLPTHPPPANFDLGNRPPPQRAASSLGRYTQPQPPLHRRPNSIDSASPPSPTFLQSTVHPPIGQSFSQHYHSSSGGNTPAVLRHHGSGSGLGLMLSGPSSSVALGSTNAPSQTQVNVLSAGSSGGSTPNPNSASSSMPHYQPTSEQWDAVYHRLVPLFQHQRIRGTLEEINDLVNAHIDQTIQRGPARALDALSRDCSALVANGMQSIGAKLVPLAQQISLTARQVHAHRQQSQRQQQATHQQQQSGQSPASPSSTYEQHYVALANRLLERLKEQWTYVYTTVLPYLEGALLPLQTNPVLVSLTARGATSKPTLSGTNSSSNVPPSAAAEQGGAGATAAGHSLNHTSSSGSLSLANNMQWGTGAAGTSGASTMGTHAHHGSGGGGGPSGTANGAHARHLSGGNAGTSAFRTQKIDVRHIVLECFRDQCLFALNGICVQPSSVSNNANINNNTNNGNIEFSSLCGEGSDSVDNGGLLRAFLREVSGESNASDHLVAQLQLPTSSSSLSSPRRKAASGLSMNHHLNAYQSGGAASYLARAESPSTVRTSPSNHPRALRAAAARAAGVAGGGISRGAASGAVGNLGALASTRGGGGGGGEEEGISLNAGLHQMKSVLCSISLDRPRMVHANRLIAV